MAHTPLSLSPELVPEISEQQTAHSMTVTGLKEKHSNDAESHMRKDIKETIDPDSADCAFHFGDIVWVKSGSSSWWPAQVTDEKGVSLSSKPKRKAESEVLVRLYGTYKYLYIDPVKNNEEFENMLKQSNSSIRQVLEKALEEDLSHIKGRRKTTEKLSLSGEMQDGADANNGAKSVAFGKHAKVGNLLNLKLHELNEKRLKKKMGNEEKKKQNGKQKSKQQDATELGQDEVKEQKVIEKARKSASNQRWRKTPKLAETTGHKLSHNSQASKKKTKQPGVMNNDKADVHGSGEHAQVGALENVELDKVLEQKVKERTQSHVKHKSRKHDATNLGQDEVKERKVKQKTLHVATNRQSKNKPKLTEKSGHGAAKHTSETLGAQRKLKQSDVTKTDNTNVCGSGKNAQVGSKSEASTRRMKVMQSLGLIAPSGSPFSKHGTMIVSES